MSKNYYQGKKIEKGKNIFRSLTEFPVKKPVKCPYCGSNMEIRSNSEIALKDFGKEYNLLVCKNHPNCDCYCRIIEKGSDIYLVSTPANASLRSLRNEAHFYFDKLHEYKIFPIKRVAYQWLTDTISPGTNVKHIGEFNEDFCIKTIQSCIRVLHNNQKIKNICFYPFVNKYSKEKATSSLEIQNMLKEMTPLKRGIRCTQ